MFSISLPPRIRAVTHHSLLASPAIALAFTALSLLLLVLVLLSVPGPIKGLYWFSVPAEVSGMGKLSAGVLGWCELDTSNCTYAPLSNNKYLSTMIDTGMALTVRIMLPLACYWSIVTLVFWVLLSILSSAGYKIKDLDSISRHLKFAVVEACVLCVTLFGNVLCWLAFGLGREAYLSVKTGGGKPKSGRAMEVTAVAALLSLFAFFVAIWGLHLRLRNAQAQWKEEAVMVRRRSMALSAAGATGRNSSLGVNVEKSSGRWSDVPEYNGQGGAGAGYRGSMVKDPRYDDEERLEAELEMAKRNSRDQEVMLKRASRVGANRKSDGLPADPSSLSPHDTPYAIAHQSSRDARA